MDLIILLVGAISHLAAGDMMLQFCCVCFTYLKNTPTPNVNSLSDGSVAPVLSCSGVPATTRSGYIESEGYPGGYPSDTHQVMSSLDETEHIKHFCRNGS